MKEIKCYTCKYRNLDPVPEDLPCVDCWNELSYVNYEPEVLNFGEPMKGKELEILRKTASRLISKTPTNLNKKEEN